MLLDGREYVRGYADHERRLSSAGGTGDTPFRIGSTTKTFTGTAVMRLVQQEQVRPFERTGAPLFAGAEACR